MGDIAISDLRELCHSVLIKTGITADHSAIIVDHYLENELSGKSSHGMVRIVEMAKVVKQYGLPQHPLEITKDQDSLVVFDGHKNFGPVVGHSLLATSIERAKRYGICLIGAHHYVGNTGSMAYYLRRLCDQGLIALMSCNSVPLVAAPEGKDRLLGTNPIGLGVPSADGRHFIADFATSAIAYGKIMVAQDKNIPIPEQCLIDKDGTPSTNPQDIKDGGAILPLADYRGFALGLFVELMAVMIGGSMFKTDWFGKDALFIIAIDPSHCGGQDYAARVSTLLETIRTSSPAMGKAAPTIPGDRSATTLQKNTQQAMVSIADKTLEDIKTLLL